jgi:hypothetical protein
LSAESAGTVAVREERGDGSSTGGVVGIGVDVAVSSASVEFSEGATVTVAVARLVGVADGVLEGAIVSVVGVGVDVMISHAGEGVGVAVVVGCGGDVPGFAGLRVGVGDGTVWRPGPWPGAAHRSGPVAIVIPSIPNKMIQSPRVPLPTAPLLPLLMAVS